MTNAFTPEEFLWEVQRRHDQLCTKGNFDRGPGLIRVIRRTAAALGAEFGRLESIYKEDKELFIPHPEKAKIYELAVDTAALCMVLCENSIQGRRQAQLILEGFEHVEDVEKLTQALDEVARQVKVEREQKDLDMELERAQRAKEEAENRASELQEVAKAKKGKKSPKGGDE